MLLEYLKTADNKIHILLKDTMNNSLIFYGIWRIRKSAIEII